MNTIRMKGDRLRWFAELAKELRHSSFYVPVSQATFVEVCQVLRLAGCGVEDAMAMIKKIWPEPASLGCEERYWSLVNWAKQTEKYLEEIRAADSLSDDPDASAPIDKGS